MHMACEVSVMCGQHMISLSVLIEIATLLTMHPSAEWRYQQISSPLEDRLLLSFKLNSWVRKEGILPKGKTITDIFASAREYSSHDPKDKVFGLFQVLDEISPKYILVDYSQPVETIYTKVTSACILYGEDLSVLYEVPSANRNPMLPSWVPDWSQRSWSTSYSNFAKKRHIECFSSAAMTETRFHFSPDLKTLIVPGKVIDKILRKGALAPDCAAWARFVIHEHLWRILEPRYQSELVVKIKEGRQVLLQWLSMAMQLGSYPNNENLLCSFQNTLSEEHHKANGIENLRRELFRQWAKEYQFADSFQLDEKELFQVSFWDFKTPSEARQYFMAVLFCWWQNKSFFITRCGCMGIAPHLFKEGDTVALVAGMEKPIILRRNGLSFHFITLAYIRGIMHGEAWSNLDHSIEELSIN